MPLIERSALVSHSAEQMFDLVNDVESYPQFMKGCESAIVHSQTDSELVGELTLARSGIKHSFTTRNTLQYPDRIDMQLVSGKFKNFSACWRFFPLNDEASKVSLKMEFEFDISIIDLAAERLFSEVANAQVDALVARADEIYGNE